MKVYIVKVGFFYGSAIKGAFASASLADAWLEKNWEHYGNAHVQKIEPSQGPDVVRYESTIRHDYAVIEEHEVQGAS